MTALLRRLRSRNRATYLRRQWPLAVLILLACVFALMLLFSRKAPVIVGIDPAMAAPGELVTVTGDYFGRTAREGQLTISGLTPPPSFIVEWGDQKIVFHVPEDAPSGLVTVANTQGTSASVLFTNTLTIPTVLKTRAESVPLEVTYQLPAEPLAGALVTLGGRGFGRGEAGSWLELAPGGTTSADLRRRILPQQTEGWSDQSLRFRLPPGLGPDTLVTINVSQSRSAPFALHPVTPVAYENPRTVTLDFPVTVPYNAGTGPLVVFAPLPEGGMVSLGSAPVRLLRWDSVSATVEARWQITVTTTDHRWNGWPSGQVIPVALQQAPPTEGLPAVPWKTQTAALKNLTNGWGLDLSDQFLKAKRLLTGLRQAFRRGGTDLGEGASVASLLSGRRLNPWEASTLAASLGQQNGLAARLVRGLLLEGNGETRPHAWVQFWVAGAGWLDVDPWELLDSGEGELEARFGSLDNRHIAWATATVYPRRQVPGSRPVEGTIPFSSQTLAAETGGTLEVGAPVWGTPKVVSGAGVP